MSIGLVGRKRGMTRVFDENGVSVPVTVVEVEPNRVVQKKDVDGEGYRGLQVTTGSRRASRVSAAAAGHYKKAGVEAGRGLWEFRVDGDWPTVAVAAPAKAQSDGEAQAEGDEQDAPEAQAAEQETEQKEIEVGNELTVSLFTEGQIVDVVGRSIGKGYGGVIKRHNFSSQRMSHGNSKSHRAPGSIGQNQSPGHVFKGKKMSGQLGNVRKTVQNQRVVRVDAERNLILISGGIPGAKGGDVVICPAVKKPGQQAS